MYLDLGMDKILLARKSWGRVFWFKGSLCHRHIKICGVNIDLRWAMGGHEAGRWAGSDLDVPPMRHVDLFCR